MADKRAVSAPKPGLAQPADLVAHAGGVLELQVARMLVHLLFQRLELRCLLGRAEADAAVLDLEAQPDRLVVAGGGVVEVPAGEAA